MSEATGWYDRVDEDNSTSSVFYRVHFSSTSKGRGLFSWTVGQGIFKLNEFYARVGFKFLDIMPQDNYEIPDLFLVTRGLESWVEGTILRHYSDPLPSLLWTRLVIVQGRRNDDHGVHKPNITSD